MFQPPFITYYLLPAYRTVYTILYYLRPRDMIPRLMCYSLTMQAKEKRKKQGFFFSSFFVPLSALAATFHYLSLLTAFVSF